MNIQGAVGWLSKHILERHRNTNGFQNWTKNNNNIKKQENKKQQKEKVW